MIISLLTLGSYCMSNTERCKKFIMDYFLLIVSTVLIIIYFYLKLVRGKRKGASFFPLSMEKARNRINERYLYFKNQGWKGGYFYLMGKSFYLPADLDLLKNILIKDFDSFVNHTAYVNEKGDPLGLTLFALKDDKWRNLRAKLSPTFTSGKMKMMFQTMLTCTELLVEVLEEESHLKEPINVKDVLSRFTTDIIGSVAFGIDCSSLKDPNCEFRQFGKKVHKFTWRKALTAVIPYSILRKFNFRMTDKGVEQFFIGMVKNITNYREENNVYRKDFMHLMLQLKNRGETTDDGRIMDDNTRGDYMSIPEMTAQCLSFFVGGFDTSSVLMTFALLEVAQQQEIQEKLRQEMKNIIKKHDGITYDGIMKMHYLDQVICETLRKHPPIFATNRVCNQIFTIPGTEEKIEKSQELLIPIYPIHHDPEFYPEPEKFDPDRFSLENKATRHHFAFLPFAEGPRMCIGSRYGLLQSKVGLTCVLTNFKVTLNSKTILPIKYDANSLILIAKGDVWLDFQKLE